MRLTELSGSLWPAAGLHTAWIFAGVTKLAGNPTSGWLTGFDGEAAGGVLAQTMLLALLAATPWLYRRANVS